ncbi:hypothetical protein IAR50_006665 [Cryptococcus sp. DSM 104548]
MAALAREAAKWYKATPKSKQDEASCPSGGTSAPSGGASGRSGGTTRSGAEFSACSGVHLGARSGATGRFAPSGAKGRSARGHGRICLTSFASSSQEITDWINSLQKIGYTNGDVKARHCCVADGGEKWKVVDWGRALESDLMDEEESHEVCGDEEIDSRLIIPRPHQEIIDWIGYLHRQGYANGELEARHCFLSKGGKEWEIVDWGRARERSRMDPEGFGWACGDEAIDVSFIIPRQP